MLPLESLISDYLELCQFQKNLSPKSIKAYTIDLHQFISFMKTTDEELNKTNLSNYITILHKTYKPKTVKRKVACLKAFCNNLEFNEQIGINPFTKIKIKFKEPLILPRTIPLSAIQAILLTAYKQLNSNILMTYQYNTCLRDIAVLELLFATGVRVSELCSLTKDNINLEEASIRIYGKGAKERVIQIGNKDVLLALKNYKNAFSQKLNNNDFFFINRLGSRLSEQSVRYMINRYVNLSGETMHITPHMFRHTFATLLLEEDVDIRYIQQLLGHSSITTTQIYTHVTSNKQKYILTTKNPRNKIIINKG